MKIRSMFVWALALVVFPQIAAAQKPDPRLNSSLAPFARERHPLRDPRRIKPYGEVNGSVPSGYYIGGATTVRLGPDMIARLRPLGERLRALDSDLSLYDVDVNVTDGELLKKARCHHQGQARCSSTRAYDLGIMKTLQAYRLVKSKQTISARRRQGGHQARKRRWSESTRPAVVATRIGSREGQPRRASGKAS